MTLIQIDLSKYVSFRSACPSISSPEYISFYPDFCSNMLPEYIFFYSGFSSNRLTRNNISLFCLQNQLGKSHFPCVRTNKQKWDLHLSYSINPLQNSPVKSPHQPIGGKRSFPKEGLFAPERGKLLFLLSVLFTLNSFSVRLISPTTNIPHSHTALRYSAIHPYSAHNPAGPHREPHRLFHRERPRFRRPDSGNRR